MIVAQVNSRVVAIWLSKACSRSRQLTFDLGGRLVYATFSWSFECENRISFVYRDGTACFRLGSCCICPARTDLVVSLISCYYQHRDLFNKEWLGSIISRVLRVRLHGQTWRSTERPQPRTPPIESEARASPSPYRLSADHMVNRSYMHAPQTWGANRSSKRPWFITAKPVVLFRCVSCIMLQ
jgi:hypothetical protein